MKKITLILLFLSIYSYGQVGIGTTIPTGALDVNSSLPSPSTNKAGLVPPTVALSASNSTVTTTAGVSVVNADTGGVPATGTIVFNTNTSAAGANQVVPGYYFWDGTIWVLMATGKNSDWSTIGNAATTASTNYLGTSDAQALVVKTNNLERMRVLSDGRVSVNNASPTSTRLFSATADATNTTAIYGTTAQLAPAILGQTTSATSTNGAVQGEYSGASIYGSGIVGFGSNTVAGTDFLGSTVNSIYGGLLNNVGRSFGIMGDTYNNTTVRTGGVIGTDGFRSGALGYYASNGNDYSVYGFNQAYTTGAAGGRSSNSQSLSTSIGLGIYGGVIGGWIKGDEYGTVFSGDRFSSYNLGKVISNEDYIVISGDNNKIVSYASTTLQPEVNAKGIAYLVNGSANVLFNKEFSQLLDKSKPIIVTCTPMGETKGIFLAEVTPQGFKIKENQNGISSVSFTWIAVGEKQISDKQKISSEILDKDFEKNLIEVMHDENLDGGKAIWSQNGKIQFGENAPKNPIKLEHSRKNLRKNYTSIK